MNPSKHNLPRLQKWCTRRHVFVHDSSSARCPALPPSLPPHPPSLPSPFPPHLKVLKQHNKHKNVIHAQTLLNQITCKKLHRRLLSLDVPQAKPKRTRGAHRQNGATDRSAVSNCRVNLCDHSYRCIGVFLALDGGGLDERGGLLLEGVLEPASARGPFGERGQGRGGGGYGGLCGWDELKRRGDWNE